jgi:SPP1 gp7 family putative phage head morphogenesis protein
VTPPPVPDKIRSNILNFMVDVHRYEAGLSRDVVDLLTELGQDLIKDLMGAGLDTPNTTWQRSRIQALLKEAKAKIDDAYGLISTTHSDEMKGLIQISGKGLTTAINEALGADVFIAPKWTREQLNAIASDTLINGAPSAEWWSRQADDVTQAFADAMRQGMLRGETVTQMRDRIMGQNIPGVNAVGKVDLRKVPMVDRGPIWKARRNAEALVRTSAITVNNAAHEAAYAANADIMAGVDWCSTLDTRTCVECGALDGRSWATDEAHPSPSLHWNCRCTLLPRTKSWEQLARESHGNSTLAKELDKMPVGNRASMGGPVSGNLNYEEWLGSQSQKRQVDILGPGKYDLWKSGKIGFSDMISQNGNALTLAELKARHG